jgi:hypothetical protein
VTNASDWSTSEWGITVENAGNSEGNELVTGPIWLLALTLGVFLIACLSFMFGNWVGYFFGVTGSGLCIFTTAVNQRRQASANYSSLSWFSPSVRAIRWLSTIVTLAHIIYLARAAGAN